MMISAPFGECRIHVYEQTVTASLLRGPLRETYNIPSLTEQSKPGLACNSVRA